MNVTLISRNEEVISKCEMAISKVMGVLVTVHKDVVSVKGKFRIKKEMCSDLYLIDADTPRMNLEEITETIREMPGNPLMILIAEGFDYALRGYEWAIFRYVQKESIEEKLGQAALDAVILKNERDEAAYCIKTHLRYLNIYYKNIKYIYKKGKNCVFVTAKGQYRIRKSMDQLSKEMNRTEFIRIARGISVNVKHIESWRGSTVILRDGTNLMATRMQPDTFE